MRYGISRAFGARLHQFIAKRTHSHLGAFFSGMGITALLQSSTATALILSGFCAQGLISASAGIAVMLGADVGTTLVAQLLSFDLSWLAPLFIALGFVLFSNYERAGKFGHIGRFLFGLGLMLLALGWIKTTAIPLKESEIFPLLIHSLDHDALLLILIVALLTWAMHSSLAMVLLLVSFVVIGIIPLASGLVMVLGANLGAVAAPVVATMKDNAAARRPPLGNMIIRIIGVLFFLPFIDVIPALLEKIDPDPGRAIVNFHMAFNLGLAITFLPLSGPLGALCTRLLPEKINDNDPKTPKYLDENSIETPVVALSGATRETLRMADLVEVMLEETMIAIRHSDERLVKKIRQQDDILDNLYRAIKMYMAKISQETLDPDDATRYVQILAFSTNLENVGDLIDKSMSLMTLKKIREHKRFSQEGWKEIQEIHGFVIETVRMAQNVFVSDNISLARQLVERKDELRLRESRLTTTHLDRIREGVPETIATSSLHLDIIRDYRRINGYMCTVAYPILEREGQLRQTRLVPIEKEEI